MLWYALRVRGLVLRGLLGLLVSCTSKYERLWNSLMQIWAYVVFLY
jgi:hypothetical protein